jgi:O-antigen ligase
MLLSLPSFEAPKNIFLILFLLTSFYRQFSQKNITSWAVWDTIFLTYIISSFLSVIFAGIPGGNEWGGFRSDVIWISLAWILSRTKFTGKEVSWIIWVAILATIPPLIWGLFEYLFLHSKANLELHSVGHVNHSAIYLGIILGATLSLSLSSWKDANIIRSIIIIMLPIIFFIAIIIAQSRGVFGISLIRLSLIIFLIPNPKKIKLFSFVIFFLILILMPVMKAPIIEKQISAQKNNDLLSDRQSAWNVSIEAWHGNPIFGVGNGNWNRITHDDLKKYREERNLSYDEKKYALEYKHSHSLYLAALSERGLIGLMALIVFMAQWLITLVKSYRTIKVSNQGSILWGGSLSAWIVTFGVGIVNTTFHHEHAILALLFLGLHLGHLNHKKKSKQPISNQK